MKFRCRSAMLALACLAMAFLEGAVAQQEMRKNIEEANRAPLMVPWTDSADDAALKECREKITQPSSTTKVGPLVPLRDASILHHGPRRGSSNLPVPQDKVRMYAARVQGTNWLGAKYDVQDVCFFEKLPTKYRFVQTCTADSKSMKTTGCDLNWIIRDPLHIYFPSR
jgi:hypothetical protein